LEYDAHVTGEAAPPFGVGGPTTAAWREDALMRAEELEALTDWFVAQRADGAASATLKAKLKKSIDSHLEATREAAEGKDSRGWLAHILSALRGSGVERALGNIDAVETHLLRLAPPDYVRGQLPSLLAQINRFLPKDDPRRMHVSAIVDRLDTHVPTRRGARPPSPKHLESFERDAIVDAYHAASSQRRRDLIRVRSFRNVILATAFLLLLVAAAVAVLGAVRPDAISLCFKPGRTPVCPTGAAPTSTDIWLVEVVGLVSASVAAAFSLRNIRGTSTPYSLPVALALLKLPTGALTAVLGLLLMRGEFVPGLSALDSSAQIISWAVVFGYAQQLFTGLVDQQAKSVLQDVGGRGAAGDRPTSSGS
jgi:hypothetical protein